MTKREYLERYRKAKKQADFADEKAAMYRDQMESISAPGDGMPTSPSPQDKMAAMMERLDELERDAEKLHAAADAIKHEVMDAISAISDAAQHSVMWQFFVECRSVCEIAQDLGYAKPTIWEKLRVGVESIKVHSEA